ncbi:MAG: hypothetical protein C0602_03225 [Denitrovibrio sp.]|nr:MAG: hypothetical protein C0602_03225 [Denitrovibrio sp.]
MNNIEKSGAKISTEILCKTVTIYPHFRGNYGFFHLEDAEWQVVFVKGVYKDNIRHLHGKTLLDDKKLNELAQTCAETERTLRKPVVLTITLNESNEHYIYDAQACETTPAKSDRRDSQIESPLTKVEKSLGKGDFIEAKHLFNRNPFSEIFPDTLSPLMMSLVSGVPDIMNPLFSSCSIKTHSPSIKLLFGRIYMNTSNVETIIPAFRQPSDFFLLNFAPSIFKKVKKPFFGIPDDSDLKIKDSEITETLDDIKQSVKKLDSQDIHTDEFVELTALCVMAWEMVYIRLWTAFTSFHKLTGKKLNDTLTQIYQTRSDSILNKDIQAVHSCFDPAVAPCDIKSLGLEHLTPDEMFKTLPSSKRLTLSKSKYIEKLNKCHEYLRMRDELFLLCSSLTGKLRSILIETGESFVKDQMITNTNDIFFFELSEINKILQDDFFGNIPFTLNFRKWQNERFSALCLPNMLYEKDIVNAEEFASAQINKSITEKHLPCLDFNHKELATENYAASLAFRLSDLQNISDKDVLISESASLLSFTAEYAFASETPLYTGAKFAGLILKDKKISTKDNGICYE